MGRVFTAPIQLRWTDLDAQGHANNVMIFEYIEQARVLFIMSGLIRAMIDDGVIIRSQKVSYRHSIFFCDDPVMAEVWVSGIGTCEVTLACRLLHRGVCCVEARTVVAPYDFHQAIPRPLTNQQCDFFGSFIDEQSPDLSALSSPDLRGRGRATSVMRRWSDLDRYQHVNNVRFLDYVLAGRVEMTSHADPSLERVAMGSSEAMEWLIARQDIDYLDLLDFSAEPLRVLTSPVHIGCTSVTLASEIIDPLSERVHARARSVMVCADGDGHKRPLPQAGRTALEKLLIAE